MGVNNPRDRELIIEYLQELEAAARACEEPLEDEARAD